MNIMTFFEHEFFEKQFYGNTISSWLISLAIVAASIVVGLLIQLFNKKVIRRATAKTSNKLDDIIATILEAPFIFAIILGSVWFAINRLHLSETVDNGVRVIYQILVVLNVTWFVSRLVNKLIYEYFIPYTKSKEESKGKKADVHVFSMIKKVAGVFIWTIGFVMALNNAGINVSTLLAGLGIGGVALALAAQDTVKNIFGGVTIFTDKPFRIGDTITVDGMTGTVEDIGIRSIRLRTFPGRLITIPNYKTVDSSVENITWEPMHRIELNLGLTYDTTPEKMNLAMTILKEMPQSISNIDKKTKVYFASYGDFSLNITCFYYIKKGKDIQETQSIVNLHILNKFNENKLDFAFPTQTLYMKKD